jgi:hypothetical protein
MQNRYRRSLLVGLVLLGAAAGDAKQAPATSDASEICPAVVSADYEPNRVPVTTGRLAGVTFSSDRTQLPSTGGGSGQQAMDICRIKTDGNLTWHGKAAARVEVRLGDNPLALGVKTASSGTGMSFEPHTRIGRISVASEGLAFLAVVLEEGSECGHMRIIARIIC